VLSSVAYAASRTEAQDDVAQERKHRSLCKRWSEIGGKRALCGRFIDDNAPNLNCNGRTLNLNYYHLENCNPSMRLREIASAMKFSTTPRTRTGWLSFVSCNSTWPDQTVQKLTLEAQLLRWDTISLCIINFTKYALIMYTALMYIERYSENTLVNKRANNKVLIVLGARQVGKTTMVKHFLAQERAVRINLDVEVEKQKLLAVAKLAPAEAVRVLGDPDFIVIDEAQRLPKTGMIVKGWYDSDIRPQVILLGSSSLNLLDVAAESLTGRNEKIFLPPLTFEEIVRSQQWLPKESSFDLLAQDFSEQVGVLLEQCMLHGSYPSTIVQSNKREFLENLVADYLLKDILEAALVKEPEVIRKLLTLVAYQTGSLVSVQELANALRISRSTVEKYLRLLEEMFIIFRLPAWSTNPRKEISKSSKIFFWDTGVRNALVGDFTPVERRADIGSLWENWVVAEFAKHNMINGGFRKLFYWRSRSGSEVDLLVKNDERLSAFEIKWRSGKMSKKATLFDVYKTKIEMVNRNNPFIEARLKRT